jgi:hypothetical protein
MSEGQFAMMLDTHKVLHDPVARELAPAGSRSGPKKSDERCALKREQAPSPQKLPSHHATD